MRDIKERKQKVINKKLAERKVTGGAA